MSLTRRSVVRGAAWSVPVVAVAAQAPAFAASNCPAIPTIAAWTETYSIPDATQFQTGSGANGFSTAYGGDTINRYVSERDCNSALGTASSATVTLSTTITGLSVGATYTLTFHLVSRFASDNNSATAGCQIQMLDVTLGSSNLLKRQKRKAANISRAGYTDFPNSPTIPSTPATTKVRETVVATYTATATSAPLTYLFTLPGRGNGFPDGCADIAISAPVFADCP